MRGFRPVDGWYVAGLGPTEREVFATVVADVAELLGAERFGVDPDDEASDDSRAPEAGSGPLDRVRMSAGAVPAPEDPAVRRLLPDASREDPAVAAEFRRLTEADLRSTKIERLRALWHRLLEPAAPAAPAGPAETARAGHSTPRSVVDDDDDLVLAADEAAAFAAALTDVRLVLAERLGLRTEADADRLYATLEAQAAAQEEQEAREALGEAGGWGAADDDRPARDILLEEMRAYLGSVYAALSWLQETLMAALLADLDPDGG